MAEGFLTVEGRDGDGLADRVAVRDEEGLACGDGCGRGVGVVDGARERGADDGDAGGWDGLDSSGTRRVPLQAGQRMVFPAYLSGIPMRFPQDSHCVLIGMSIPALRTTRTNTIGCYPCLAATHGFCGETGAVLALEPGRKQFLARLQYNK